MFCTTDFMLDKILVTYFIGHSTLSSMAILGLLSGDHLVRYNNIIY